MTKKSLIITALIFMGSMFALAAIPVTSNKPKIELNKTNFTAISTIVTSESVGKVMLDIGKSDPKKPFYIFLDTDGGDVIAGSVLTDYLKVTNRNISCIAKKAISMGFVILQACPNRIVLDHPILMMHHIQSAVQGSSVDMENHLKVVKMLEDSVLNQVSERIGITRKTLNGRINPEWWLFDPKTIIKDNVADSSAIVTCTLDLEKGTEVIQVPGFLTMTEKTVSTCPIMR